MQPLKNFMISDTSRLDRADDALVSALRVAGENADSLSQILEGRTASDVRCACEALLSTDRTRGRQVALIATLMQSRMLANFAMNRVDRDPYYSLEDRKAVQIAWRGVHEEHEKSQGARKNGHPKQPK